MQDPNNTKEPQYQFLLDNESPEKRATFGYMSSQVYRDDPKRLTFLLSRYKFVSKLLSGKARVAEIGCADAFGTPIVAKEVGQLDAYDFDPLFIADAKKRLPKRPNIHFATHDLIAGPLPAAKPYDAAFACDVFEHIPPEREDAFLENIASSLTDQGVLILGMPSLESQIYASLPSKEGHVNCKSGDDFKTTMERHFQNVFLFSMNDEVVHTGFSKMAHYLFALCITPSSDPR